MVRSYMKSLRLAKRLTNEQMAKKIGVTTSYYNKLELGKKNPSIQTAFKLATFFDCPIEDLFGDTFTVSHAM